MIMMALGDRRREKKQKQPPHTRAFPKNSFKHSEALATVNPSPERFTCGNRRRLLMVEEEDSRSMAPPRNTVPVAEDPGCDMSGLEAKNTLSGVGKF